MKDRGQRSQSKQAVASAVDRIASTLRGAALTSADGAYLGSEASLTAEFGVSAPTLRQAARLLEHEQVLRVQRGVLGGYYARRPRIDAVARVAATYLRGNPGSLSDVMVVMRPLTAVVVDQVIRNEHAAAALQQFAAPPEGEPLPHVALQEGASFLALLIKAVNNAPLQLILSIFYDFGVLLPPPQGGFDRALARRTREVRAALARALIAKDAVTAEARMLEHQQLIVQRIETTLVAAEA